jgi:hypothetical protein
MCDPGFDANPDADFDSDTDFDSNTDAESLHHLFRRSFARFSPGLGPPIPSAPGMRSAIWHVPAAFRASVSHVSERSDGGRGAYSPESDGPDRGRERRLT